MIGPHVADQAAGLRALFARRSPRLLPVLVAATHDAARTVWLARLAEAFARSGQRTLLIDGARSQVASALGLLARYDWWHAASGECTPRAALLDAAPDLTVLPAARALDAASLQRVPLAQVLLPAVRLDPACELVLLLVAPVHAALLPAGDVLVPVLGSARELALALALIGTAAQAADIAAFRLLFLGMDQAAAGTLISALRERAQHGAGAHLHQAGWARVARDLARTATAARNWTLAPLAPPALEIPT